MNILYVSRSVVCVEESHPASGASVCINTTYLDMVADKRVATQAIPFA
jgi:hypothetical protein